MNVYILGDFEADSPVIVDIFSSEASAEAERKRLYRAYANSGYNIDVTPWAVQD
jgi:hypothetical protein